MRTLASLGGLLVALVGPGASFAGPRIYCCHDDSGKQVCGDILPSVCYGRAYRELGDSGRTSRLVDAPLTVEQRAQRAAEEQRRKEQERVLNEQRRMDQALLNTYASEKDIEIMRSRAERDLTMAIKAAEERIAEIRKQRKKFEDEAEFYRNRQLPAEVAKGLRDADYEIGAQESVIESKKRDQETMRAKYDEDLRRFRDLSKRPSARP
ncbi:MULTISPECIES: hypothetical protein [Candidatus Accumulibacter]|uniref:hypothetical protein n=1 Tax=Candidatus Accumulibacter TaxID=327159 RepID=UPI001B0ABA2F|nr:hypothetical protein [Accumulibacter sp.]MBO3714027.1 hypothetical protein [Accumulibacter sp.]